MKIIDFLSRFQSDFFTGVPDSTLRSLGDYLMNTKGIGSDHIIAANEGNSIGIAAGHYLATGEVPIVYMQNSGIGNAINPITSLLNEKVYAIPCIFLVGWRGEPGTSDEPQHKFQGEITIELLETVGIKVFIISNCTVEEELLDMIQEGEKLLQAGRSIAFLIKKGAITNSEKREYVNSYQLIREEAIEQILKCSQEDIVVASTGKIGREVFEVRERNRQSHQYDFLSVGSMGHCSSIALGIAKEKPQTRVWCLDGDGSVLMHMGAVAVIGASQINNLVHIVFNNEAHESVGGLPTVSGRINLPKIFMACGYKRVYCVETIQQLCNALDEIKSEQKLCFLEIKVAIGSRGDLGRPTISTIENKKGFMKYLNQVN